MAQKISKFERINFFFKTKLLYFSSVSILVSIISLGVVYTFSTPNKLPHKITCQKLEEQKIKLMHSLKKTKSYGDSLNYLSKQQYLETLKKDLKCNE
jgi:hypothetical protein